MFKLDELVSQLIFGNSFTEEVSGARRIIRLPAGEADSFKKTHCPVCQKDRRMRIFIIHSWGTLLRLVREIVVLNDNADYSSMRTPSLVRFQCVQCLTDFHTIIYEGPGGPALASFPARSNGLATASTPREVAHFLNQAYRCSLLGANGAAVAMYRAALEQLLTELGYIDGMLSEKTTKLLADVEAGNSPSWAEHLDLEMFEVIRKLGNAVVHPKKLTQLHLINEEVVQGVAELFQFLLSEIYEVPNAEKEFLAKFGLAEEK